MTTTVYVAIAATSKTGNTVADNTGYTYAATFSSLTAAQADATHGAKDISSGTGSDENYFYDVFDSYTEPENVLFDTGLWTIIDNLLTIRAAPGYEHAGTPGSGVIITATDSFQNMYNIGERAIFSNLEFIATGHGASYLIQMSGGVAHRLIAKSTSTTTPEAAFMFTNNKLSKVISCLAHNSGTHGFYIASYRYGSIYNCAAINNTGVGISLGSSGSSEVYIRNNLCLDNAGGDFVDSGRASYTAAKNASSDASAFGTSPVINLTSSNEVENPITPDPHLKAGNSIETLGDDLFTLGFMTTSENKDIDGQPFTGWPIGCDQPGAFTVPVTITVKDGDTLLPVVGAAVYFEVADLTQTHYGVTDANGQVYYDMPFTLVQGISGRVRKGSVAPYYRTGVIQGTLTGDGFEQTVFVTKDGDS